MPSDNQSQSQSQDQAWTTAKCMRVLRPLESSLISLRRLRANAPLRPAYRRGAFSVTIESNNFQGFGPINRRQDGLSDDQLQRLAPTDNHRTRNDIGRSSSSALNSNQAPPPDWLTNKEGLARKKKTYAQRRNPGKNNLRNVDQQPVVNTKPWEYKSTQAALEFFRSTSVVKIDLEDEAMRQAASREVPPETAWDGLLHYSGESTQSSAPATASRWRRQRSGKGGYEDALLRDPSAMESMLRLKMGDKDALPFIMGVCQCLHSLFSSLDPRRFSHGGMLSGTAAEAKTGGATLRAARRPTGSKSLVELSLLQVSTHIRNEQLDLLQQHKEPNSAVALAEAASIADKIYEEVGELLPAEPRSRELMVRSQARVLMRLAITDNLFNDDALRLIVRVCFNADAQDEARHFVETFLHHLRKENHPCSTGQDFDIFTLLPLQDMVWVKLASGSEKYYHKALRSLFDSGSFSTGCVPSLNTLFSAEIKTVVKRTVYDSPAMDTCLDICELVVLQLSGGRPSASPVTDQTISEVRCLTESFMEHLAGVCLVQEYKTFFQSAQIPYEALSRASASAEARSALLRRLLEIPLRVVRAGHPDEIRQQYPHSLNNKAMVFTALTAVITHTPMFTNDGLRARQLLRAIVYLNETWHSVGIREVLSQGIARLIKWVVDNSSRKPDMRAYHHKLLEFCSGKVKDFLDSEFVKREEVSFEEKLGLGMVFARSAAIIAEQEAGTDMAFFDLVKDFEGFMVRSGLVLASTSSSNTASHAAEPSKAQGGAGTGPSKSDFVWDDGLSEWIPKTPFQQRKGFLHPMPIRLSPAAGTSKEKVGKRVIVTAMVSLTAAPSSSGPVHNDCGNDGSSKDGHPQKKRSSEEFEGGGTSKLDDEEDELSAIFEGEFLRQQSSNTSTGKARDVMMEEMSMVIVQPKKKVKRIAFQSLLADGSDDDDL